MFLCEVYLCFSKNCHYQHIIVISSWSDPQDFDYLHFQKIKWLWYFPKCLSSQRCTEPPSWVPQGACSRLQSRQLRQWQRGGGSSPMTLALSASTSWTGPTAWHLPGLQWALSSRWRRLMTGRDTCRHWERSSWSDSLTFRCFSSQWRIPSGHRRPWERSCSSRARASERSSDWSPGRRQVYIHITYIIIFFI